MNEQRSSIKYGYAIDNDQEKALINAMALVPIAGRVVSIKTGACVHPSGAGFTNHAFVFYSITTQVPVLTSQKINQNG